MKSSHETARRNFFLGKFTRPTRTGLVFCILSLDCEACALYFLKYVLSIEVGSYHHYSFSRSKYFHLLIAPIEGFISLIGLWDRKMMLPPYYFYWFKIDTKHMTEPWLDQALMDSAFRSLIDSISLYALVKESSCMPSPLAPDPIRVQSCVCCLF